jgi:hypothetical protein
VGAHEPYIQAALQHGLDQAPTRRNCQCSERHATQRAVDLPPRPIAIRHVGWNGELNFCTRERARASFALNNNLVCMLQAMEWFVVFGMLVAFVYLREETVTNAEVDEIQKPVSGISDILKSIG